jgi:hypothetical protein
MSKRRKHLTQRAAPGAAAAIPAGDGHDGPAMNYRSAPVSIRVDGPSTVDEATRSVEIVMTTENPVQVYDWDRGNITEVLLMSGCRMPGSRQVVMLDAHSRYSTSTIIGSGRDMKISGDRLLGRAIFSSAPEAESPWIKTREGHLTDFSLGYRVDEAVWIPSGQTAVVDGRRFSGPLQVATQWTPREISPVPIGADSEATSRSETQPTKDKEVSTMDKKLRDFLEKRGLAATATEEEAWAFLDQLGKRAEQAPAAAAAVTEPDQPPDTEPTLDEVRAAAAGEEQTRIREIDALLARYECQEMARELIVTPAGKSPVSLADAQRRVMDKLAARKVPAASGVVMGVDSRDKFRAALTDALIFRANGILDKPILLANPAPGSQELRGYTLVEMARECLRASGLSYGGTIKEMVGRALTASDFPNILANLATKSLQQGWDDAGETWQIWCALGSVNDFKVHYDNALSEFDDLEEVPDSGEIKYGSFSEKTPETYRAYQYSKKFRVTRVMIINDDLGAFTAAPAKRSEAANRKIGDIVYAILTGNGNMGDGNALFGSDHSNDATSGYRSAPGTLNITEGVRAMATHKDIKGVRRLNIPAVFFIGPVALRGTAETFFTSDKFTDSNTVATDSAFASTRNNIYAGNVFTRVYDARLDADSVTAWYLAARKGKTVKVVGLNGAPAPLLEVQQPGFSVEGFEYLVSIDAGAYAQDYRGLYRNEGA